MVSGRVFFALSFALLVLLPAQAVTLRAQEEETVELTVGKPALTEAQKRRAEELIRALDADTFEARQAASAELQTFGEPVLGLLEAALAEPASREARTRLTRLVEAIRLEEIRRNALHLDTIFEEVRLANRGQLNEARLEALLERLLEVLRATTGKKDLALPVRFADVRPAAEGGHGGGELLLGSRVKATSIRNSIVLADCAAEFTSASNSIIIARVASGFTSTQNCLVLSGYCGRTTSVQGGIMLAGAECRFTSAQGAIVGAADSLSGTIAREETVLINSPAEERLLRDGVASVASEGLILRPAAAGNPLAGRLTLTFAEAGDSGLALFKLPDGTGEYVARLDQELRKPDGAAISTLKGWKLTYTGHDFAVFGDGERYAYLPVEK